MPSLFGWYCFSDPVHPDRGQWHKSNIHRGFKPKRKK